MMHSKPQERVAVYAAASAGLPGFAMQLNSVITKAHHAQWDAIICR